MEFTTSCGSNLARRLAYYLPTEIGSYTLRAVLRRGTSSSASLPAPASATFASSSAASRASNEDEPAPQGIRRFSGYLEALRA